MLLFVILNNQIILYLQGESSFHKHEIFHFHKNEASYNIIFIKKIMLHLQEQRVLFSQTPVFV